MSIGQDFTWSCPVGGAEHELGAFANSSAGAHPAVRPDPRGSPGREDHLEVRCGIRHG
jgi:hypothetical protein